MTANQITAEDRLARLGIHLPDAPGDDLCVLRTEIEDENLAGHG